MKYVMLHKPLGPDMVQEIPIIFPNSVVHADVVEALKKIDGYEDLTVASAGFVRMTVHETHGFSDSLGNVYAKKEDADSICVNDYFSIKDKVE